MARSSTLRDRRRTLRTLPLLALFALINHAHAQAGAPSPIFPTTTATSQTGASSTPTTLTTSYVSASASSNPSGTAYPSSFIPESTGSTQHCYDNSNCPGYTGSNNNTSTSYYFIFIAIFFVILGAVLWTVRQRRRKRLQQGLGSRQNALARDMQNSQFDQMFPNSRRWTGEGRGHRRSGTGNGRSRGSGGGVQTSRDEGLNEAGEAPPAYKRSGNEEGGNAAEGIAIPMQTFQPGDRNKPPEYAAAVEQTAAGGEAQAGNHEGWEDMRR